MPYADKLNDQIILIVLTGKTNRTGAAAPNQYRKTVQQRVVDSLLFGKYIRGDITTFFVGLNIGFSNAVLRTLALREFCQRTEVKVFSEY